MLFLKEKISVEAPGGNFGKNSFLDNLKKASVEKLEAFFMQPDAEKPIDLARTLHDSKHIHPNQRPSFVPGN